MEIRSQFLFATTCKQSRCANEHQLLISVQTDQYSFPHNFDSLQRNVCNREWRTIKIWYFYIDQIIVNYQPCSKDNKIWSPQYGPYSMVQSSTRNTECQFHFSIDQSSRKILNRFLTQCTLNSKIGLITIALSEILTDDCDET